MEIIAINSEDIGTQDWISVLTVKLIESVYYETITER